jgi:hypothetical protein
VAASRSRTERSADKLTLVRSYISRAFFIASLSAILSTSPWSCLTFCCQPWFLSISSLNTRRNTLNGDWGGAALSSHPRFFSSLSFLSFLSSLASSLASLRRRADTEIARAAVGA